MNDADVRSDSDMYGDIAHRMALRVIVAAESQCGTGRVGLQSLSAAKRSYDLASIETTLRLGLMPNLGAAARIASAM